MNSQLLALDTILPSLLAFGGLVFLALAFLPWVARVASASLATTAALVIVGIACLAVGVVLWTQLLRTQVSSAAAQPAVPSPPASSAAASAAVSKPSAAATAAAATPVLAPTATLAPVAALAFQPDSGPAHDVTVAIESFQHGLMVYRSDTKQIYVLNENKTFKVYPDTWDESQPDSGDLTPVPGTVEPKRGFGKLWRANPEVRQQLGWALSSEAGLTAQISGDGSSSTIRANLTYVFKKDGTYSTQ